MGQAIAKQGVVTDFRTDRALRRSSRREYDNDSMADKRRPGEITHEDLDGYMFAKYNTEIAELSQMLLMPGKCSELVVLHGKEIENMLNGGLSAEDFAALSEKRNLIKAGSFVSKDGRILRLQYLFEPNLAAGIRKKGALDVTQEVCRNTSIFYVKLARLFNAILFMLHTTSEDRRFTLNESTDMKAKLIGWEDPDNLSHPLRMTQMAPRGVTEKNSDDSPDDEVDSPDDDDSLEDDDDILDDDSVFLEDSDDDETQNNETQKNEQIGGEPGKKNKKKQSGPKKEKIPRNVFERRMMQEMAREMTRLIPSLKNISFSRLRLTHMLNRSAHTWEDAYAKFHIRFNKNKDKYEIDYNVPISEESKIYIQPLFCNANLGMPDAPQARDVIKGGYRTWKGIGGIRPDPEVEKKEEPVEEEGAIEEEKENAVEEEDEEEKEEKEDEEEKEEKEEKEDEEEGAIEGAVEEEKEDKQSRQNASEEVVQKLEGKSDNVSTFSFYYAGNEDYYAGEYDAGEYEGKGKGKGKGKGAQGAQGKGAQGAQGKGAQGKGAQGAQGKGAQGKGNAYSTYDAYHPATLGDIQSFMVLESLFYDEWGSGFETGRKMSPNNERLYKKAVEKLAEVFMEKRDREYKKPTRFSEVRFRDVRSKIYLNYFCENNENANDAADLEPTRNAKDVLRRPITVPYIIKGSREEKYILLIVEYLNKMRAFEKKLYKVLNRIFTKTEVFIVKNGERQVQYTTNSDLTMKTMNDLTETVRDEGIEYMMECERIFQKAMYQYKMMVFKYYDEYIRSARNTMLKKSQPNLATKEIGYWDQMHSDTLFQS